MTVESQITLAFLSGAIINFHNITHPALSIDQIKSICADASHLLIRPCLILGALLALIIDEVFAGISAYAAQSLLAPG